MKYIDADKLKAEIERRRLHFNKEAEKYQALNNGYSQNCYGARDALRDLENFLDSLPEQPVEGLEEEIDKWVISLQNEPGSKWKHSDILRTARHFAEWRAEHLKR